MTGVLAFLQDNERQALAEYVSRLLAGAGQRIRQVVLFGSKARGDAGADSDLDVLVIVDRYDPQLDRLEQFSHGFTAGVLSGAARVLRLHCVPLRLRAA